MMVQGAATLDACPVKTTADPRKTAELSARNIVSSKEAVQVIEADRAKAILRSKQVKQAGFGAEDTAVLRSLANPPVIMIDGEAHRRQRAATARFFSPVAVTSRYTPLMEVTTERLIDRFQTAGKARLEDLSMEIAVTIAADIVGLTASSITGMTHRLEAMLSGGNVRGMGFWRGTIGALRSHYRRLAFFFRDVKPAIAQRRRSPREDVISHMMSAGHPDREILVECITYGIAGMITTREFIVMAFWHMMEDDQLKARFLASDRRDQLPLLEEILRTEPIVGQLARRATEDIELPTTPPQFFPAGTLFEIDVRAVNADEAVVGNCPRAIDPDRPIAQKAGGSMFAFGDGAHRCPGSQVAMLETAIFLERLLKVPGLRLVTPPKLGWKAILAGYEVADAIIVCDSA